VPEAPKVALVAGGSAGVGQAFCAALHAAGYRVYGTSRKPADAAWPMLAMELRDPASVEACVAEVLRREGCIDVLVTGAGRYIAGAVEETSDADVEEMLDLYLLGAWRMIRAALPAMRARRSGHIICMNSAAAEIAIPFHSAYSASKRALEGLVEALRLEVAPFDIHVSTIQATGIKGTSALDAMGCAERALPSYAPTRDWAIQRFAGTQGSGMPLERVSAALLALLAARRPPLHRRIGAARILPRLRLLLPEWLFHRAIAASFLARP
jgi:NAD(P)-dependent dehydrogenase (short-subunit alcohol dehydrogenase family)